MIRVNIEEDREATMARFLSSLNKEIADIVELHHCVELEEMVNIAMKVERQLKSKGTTRSYGSNSNWNSKWSKKEEKIKEKSFGFKEEARDFNKDKDKGTPSSIKGTFDLTSTDKHKNIKCLRCLGVGHIASQCPNKVMIIRDNGDIKSEFDSDCDNMPSLEDCDDDVEYAACGESLVIRRALNMQVKEEILEQRENLFYTRCLVSGKVCVVIIDGGTCANVASTTLVEKLCLKCEKHPRPYKLQWLNDYGEVKVIKQVIIPFSIGKYVDEILCDVMPMQAGHLL